MNGQTQLYVFNKCCYLGNKGEMTQQLTFNLALFTKLQPC